METDKRKNQKLPTNAILWKIAYGAYDNNQLAGFIEGYLEEWNNRFRITNLFIFKEEYQNKGIGTRLINKVFKEAKNSNARMVVLETQSYNSKAISFYERNGFEIIGFDRYAYRNNDPSRHEMRIELGKKVLIWLQCLMLFLEKKKKWT